MLKFSNTTANDGGAATFLCSACERAPAEFVCKADSASLCAACDAEVHSANPLARRHHRVPIKPVPGGLEIRPPGNGSGLEIRPPGNGKDEYEEEAASWLLMNPIKNDDEEIAAALFDGGGDEYLDLDEYNSFNEGYNCQQQHSGVPQCGYGSESDVRMQYKGKNDLFGMGLEGGYAYHESMSQSVSISSMDIGVVPELTSDVSNSYTRPSKGTIDLFSSPPATQLSPMDREARVLRYREKKKTRRFEKTIRYASRKAYAETRPRIKGRFAKRKDQQLEVDQMFASASLMVETGYGIVPTSF